MLTWLSDREPLGLTGNTGASTDEHLYLTTKKGWQSI